MCQNVSRGNCRRKRERTDYECATDEEKAFSQIKFFNHILLIILYMELQSIDYTKIQCGVGVNNGHNNRMVIESVVSSMKQILAESICPLQGLASFLLVNLHV